MIEGTEYFQQDRASSLSYQVKCKLLYDASFQQDLHWYHWMQNFKQIQAQKKTPNKSHRRGSSSI